MMTQIPQTSGFHFIQDNLSILGFANPQDALLFTVKELVENSIDACQLVPRVAKHKITVTIVPNPRSPNIVTVTVTDTGVGLELDSAERLLGTIFSSTKSRACGISQESSVGKFGMGVKAVLCYALSSQPETSGVFHVISSCSTSNEMVEMQLTFTPEGTPSVLANKRQPKRVSFAGTCVRVEIKGDLSAANQKLCCYFGALPLLLPTIEFTLRGPDLAPVLAAPSRELFSSQPNDQSESCKSCELHSFRNAVASFLNINDPKSLAWGECTSELNTLQVVVGVEIGLSSVKEKCVLELFRFVNCCPITALDTSCKLSAVLLTLKQWGNLGIYVDSKPAQHGNSMAVHVSINTSLRDTNLHIKKITMFAHLKSPNVRFTSLKKQGVELASLSQTALQSSADSVLERLKSQHGDLFLSRAELERHMLLDVSIPSVAQSIGEIVAASHNGAFVAKCLRLLGVERVGEVGSEVERRLAQLVLTPTDSQQVDSLSQTEQDRDSQSQRISVSLESDLESLMQFSALQ